MREVLETDPETGVWRKALIDGVVHYRYKCQKCGLTAVTMREQLYQEKICPHCFEPGDTRPLPTPLGEEKMNRQKPETPPATNNSLSPP